MAAPKLTVAELEVFSIRVNRRGNWTILRLQTDGGVSGLGEASQSDFQDAETLAHLKQFAELLRGRSIFDVEWFRKATHEIVRNRLGAAVAASALEQCLWDIQGKAFSVPIYELFGGRIHERITVYANINRSTEVRTPDGFSQMAEKAVKAGFHSVKLAPFDEMPMGLKDRAKVEFFMQHGVRCAQSVRHAIGADRDLMVDVHSRFNLADGLELARRFEPLDLYWLEEVTPPDSLENLAAINKAATMPTAGGEHINGVAGFYSYIEARAADIIMPDVKVCGGMLELKKIAAMAEGAGRMTSPHGPASPVGNFCAAQVIATAPNFNTLEFSYGEVPWRAELIDPPEQIEQGALVVSTRPGLGITLNEKIAAKYASSP